MTNQWLYIVTLMSAGAAMGTVFDVYNTVTGASRWLRWLRPTLDLLFWAASAVLTYLCVFTLDNGRLRLYTFCLLAAGYVFYRMTLHRRVVGSAFTIIRSIEAVLRAAFRVITVLTIRPLMTAWRIVVSLAKTAYHILCILEDVVFWVLRFWLRLSMLPRLARAPRVQAVWRRISGRWEEIIRMASKWLKTKMERV